MATKLEYKHGDVALSGQTIEFIYGHSPDLIVYRDALGGIHWETADDCLNEAGLLANQKYDELKARVEASLPQKRHKRFRDPLASALFLGLSEQTAAAALAHFDHVAGEIKQQALEQGRVNYVFYSSIVSAFVLSVSLGALIITAEPKFGLFAVAGGAGAAGAWASVLQRVAKLELGAFDNPDVLMLQGVTRVILGTLFGIVSLLAIKAGILLSAAGSSFSAIALIAFLAGFSERFVPELLNAMERRTTENGA